MTWYDDPDDWEIPDDDEDQSEPVHSPITEEILSGLIDFYHVESIEDLPIEDVADIEDTGSLRGIHFPDLIQAINYTLKSPAMIPFTSFVKFGEDDYGLAVRASG